MSMLLTIVAIAGLIVGFGLVVFFHELGHFLAAKWVGIRVEQFAVGFGHALLAWRKGIGLRVGTTRHEYEGRIREHLAKKGVSGEPTPAQIATTGDELGLGETEYRFNWMPLGGYVKMMGQDDLNPNAQVDDPRAYNRKSVGARMVVVSAGVIMNVILAAVLFSAVFLMGYHVPPAIVGYTETNSPAEKAGLQTGDKILTLDGRVVHDYNNLQLAVALSRPGEPIPMTVRRAGKVVEMEVQPERLAPSSSSFVIIGVKQMFDLRAAEDMEKEDGSPFDPATELLSGDVITAVNGTPVNQNYDPKKPTSIDDEKVWDSALQSGARFVELKVRQKDGKERTVKARVALPSEFFERVPFNIAGLQPRAEILMVQNRSPVKETLKAGDVVNGLYVNGELARYPSLEELIRLIHKAGADGSLVGLRVERDGQTVNVPAVVPSVKVAKGTKGLGMQPVLATGRPVVADVLKGSAAQRARIPRGALIQKINGQAVEDWMQVREALLAAKGTASVEYVELDALDQPTEAPQTATLELTDAEQKTLENIRYLHTLALKERIEVRRTSNPLVAARWGAVETRDQLLQFYLTLRRLVQGDVSPSNFIGPLGIVHAGSYFAAKGPDWLLWFLAMISANLAVVNFLPIPVVDGGLFLFLVLEKISGKPLSPRMQTVAQLVGLAIILSVFVFVTYQDIHRLL